MKTMTTQIASFGRCLQPSLELIEEVKKGATAGLVCGLVTAHLAFIGAFYTSEGSAEPFDDMLVGFTAMSVWPLATTSLGVVIGGVRATANLGRNLW